MEDKRPSPVDRSWVRFTLYGLAIAFFLLFLWPTPFEYTRKAPYVYRVNRFTGATDVSSGNGWVRRP